MLPDIQIKDNFLTKKELEIVNSNIQKISYKAVDNEDGNFGFRHFFEKNLENEWFFKKIKKQLHSYLGFVQNRAIFFDGKNNTHTDLQALGESSPRYTINIFYDYE